MVPKIKMTCGGCVDSIGLSFNIFNSQLCANFLKKRSPVVFAWFNDKENRRIPFNFYNRLVETCSYGIFQQTLDFSAFVMGHSFTMS